jgi:hypothetical protein
MGNGAQLGCQVAQRWPTTECVCDMPPVSSVSLCFILHNVGFVSCLVCVCCLSVNMRDECVSPSFIPFRSVTAADQWSHLSGQGHVFDSVYGCPGNKHPTSASFLLPCCPLSRSPVILPFP